MKEKNKRSDILRLAACGIVAALWFVLSVADLPGRGRADPLSFLLGIAFSVKFFLELRKCWRSREKKS